MDTKLKSDSKFKIISIVFLAIVMALSILTVSLYSFIENMALQSSSSNYGSSSEMIEYIKTSNYAIAYDILNEKNENKLSPWEVFGKYNEENVKERVDEVYEEIKSNEPGTREEIIAKIETNIRKEAKDSFINEFGEWKDYLIYELKNLKYYVIDNSNNKIITNKDELKLLVKDKIDEDTLKYMKEEFEIFVTINFDDKGNITILNSDNQDDYYMIQRLQSVYETRNGLYDLKPITNMTIAYGIPRNLEYRDMISHIKYSEFGWRITEISAMIMSGLTALILFLALVIPYKREEELISFRVFKKLCLEFKVALGILSIMMLVLGVDSIVYSTITKNFEMGLKQFGIIGSQYIIMVCNVIYWAIFFALVFIGGVFIKSIFKDGFKETILDNSLVIRILRYILNKCKEIYNKFVFYVTSEELGKRPYKTLIVLLLINFVVVAFMCFSWVIGVMLSVIYTMGLFYFGKRILEKHIESYNKLTNLSEEVCSGNFDAKEEGDLGIYNPIAQNIMKTSEGFKTAVEKEVRSEKMKTELISNVSHDLKTPLTSIINYVDLMKDENLDEEKKQEYLDILDKKSQRLKVLIEDLFEASKATSGNITLNKEDINIVALMKQTLTELSYKIDKSDLIFRNNFSSEKIMLHLDGRRTFRILENIIVNTTKYAMTGSRVYLDIIEKDEFVEITCKNMSKVEMNFDESEIVERFIRGDKSRNTEGSGLGLSITKSLVELQGGSFRIVIDGDLFKVEIKFPKSGLQNQSTPLILSQE